MLTLYSYFRSSASYRVRIALELKHLAYEYQPVHLLRNGGEQRSAAFTRLNPQALVPVLVDSDFVISQSMAIMAYLEERFPQTPLLPPGIQERAFVRQIAQYICCEIHPLNNLRVPQYLQQQYNFNTAQKQQWIAHWISTGFHALETQLAQQPGPFCFGNSATLADCCLIPQIYNARRFEIDMTAYPRLQAIDLHCSTLEAFQKASPEAQMDAKATVTA